MGKCILVAYASKYGATKEIANRIGSELQNKGLNTDILPVNKITNLNQYDVVILGSAVYIGGWRKKAIKFIKNNEKHLLQKKVWLFSSGPTGKGDPAELLKDWNLPKSIQPIADRIHPVSIAVFHGDVNLEKLNPLERWMVKKVKAPVGDFRDWEAISDWAKSIIYTIKSDIP